MDRLPFEVLLQIFGYLPLTSFQTLYTVFPRVLLDEALIYKLRRNKADAMVHLISTNLHELSTNTANSRNESSLSLYFDSYDPTHRFIWTLPDFGRSQHYFKVKDAYVSHGKLVLRRPHDTAASSSQKSLVSLWDIRKSFPPTRAGSFSGASEYSRIKSQELTIHQSGCILDSCLIPSGTSSNVKKVSLVDNNTGEDKVIGIHSTSGGGEDTNKVLLKRPALPPTYMREVPQVGTKHGTHSSNARSEASFLMPTYPDPTCGYFLVERFAIDIPTFLRLYC